MSRTKISTGSKWEPIVGYSRAVQVGSYVHVSGTTAGGADGQIVGRGDLAAQTRAVPAQHRERAQESRRQARADVVRTRMFVVVNIAEWELAGKAHGEFFGGSGRPPPWSKFRSMIAPEMLIEIEADAWIEE